MKESFLLFARDTYQSTSGGAVRTYVCRDEVRKKMGQAKSIRIQAIGYRRTTNARVKLEFWETPMPGVRPSELIPGGTPMFTSTNITSLRPVPEQINGPFCDNVEVTLEIDEATPATLQEWDGEVWATLIYEE